MHEQLVTLCFVVKDGQVLLMRKKRGIGVGKINAPGGKVEPGETPLEGAIRETVEEVCVTPVRPDLRGQLWFHFRAGPTLRCHIFLAHDFSGTPEETDEAIPLWFPLDSIPYGEMWEDDRIWLPLLLEGNFFEGEVHVDGERVTARSIRTVNTATTIS